MARDINHDVLIALQRNFYAPRALRNNAADTSNNMRDAVCS